MPPVDASLASQELLGTITVLRWDAIQVNNGATRPGPPSLMEQEFWYFQRSCPAIEAVVSNLQKVQAGLPSVVADLRTHAMHLSPACVSPERSDFGQNAGAVAVLGEHKVAHNAAIWKIASQWPPGIARG